MNSEFHYYINYILAVEAAFTLEQSYKIAYSSQYIDDNTACYNLYNLRDKRIYRNDYSQTFNIFYNEFELIKRYSCFHFLPGDLEKLDAKLKKSKIACTITTPNSSISKLVLRKALATKNPYLIGIASHAFADTWAHQNFSALNHPINSQTGIIYDLIPNYGHADFFTSPDLISHTWHDYRLTTQIVVNNDRFIDAAKNLFIEYASFNKLNNIEFKVRKLCKNIKSIIYSQKLADALFAQSGRIEEYHKLCQKNHSMKIPIYNCYEWEQKSFFYNSNEKKHFIRYNFENTDWYHFQQAVKKYQNETWKIIKNLYE